MLMCTDDQAGLSMAMTAPINAHVNRGAAWIGRRRFAVRDLHVLRPARLVRIADGFKLTDDGAAEARRHREQASASRRHGPRPELHGIAAVHATTEQD